MWTQVAVLAIGVAAIGLTPPANGVMLALPLAGQPRLAAVVLEAGGVIMGRGPLPGSILLRGRRAVLFSAMLGARAILLATPDGGCGDPRERS